MSQLWWILGGLTGLTGVGLALRGLAWARGTHTRAAALEAVRARLGDGRIERGPGGRVARGRLESLEVTVEIQRDATRPRQSPMWRVLARGPIALDHPVEARVGGWEGWIDPWLHVGETLMVPSGAGPEFSLHAEANPTLDHPLVAVLRRRGARLGPGAIHARPGLLRVETRLGRDMDDNRALFAYLEVIAEVARLWDGRAARLEGRAVPRHGVRPEGR